jgi:hypothetical protein
MTLCWSGEKKRAEGGVGVKGERNREGAGVRTWRDVQLGSGGCEGY